MAAGWIGEGAPPSPTQPEEQPQQQPENPLGPPIASQFESAGPDTPIDQNLMEPTGQDESVAAALARPHQDTAAHPVQNTTSLLDRIGGALSIASHAVVAANESATAPIRNWETEGPGWGSVATAIPHEFGAEIQNIEAGAQEGYGAWASHRAARTVAALNVLPQVAARTQASSPDQQIAAMAKDPLVSKTARVLGMSPQDFAAQWNQYRDYTDDQRATLAQQAQAKLTRAQQIEQAGSAQRRTAFAAEQQWTPKGAAGQPIDPWSLKGIAFHAAGAIPDTLAIAGASIGGAAVGGPVGGIAAGSAAAVSLMAPQQYAGVQNKIDQRLEQLKAQAASARTPLQRDQALRDATDLATNRDKIAQTATILYGASDVAGSLPVASVLSKVPGGRAVLDRIVGATLAKTVGGRIAGLAVANGAGAALQTAIQKGIDTGIIHERQPLSDALKDIAYSGVIGAVTGAGLGAAMAPKIRAQLADEAAADILSRRKGLFPESNSREVAPTKGPGAASAGAAPERPSPYPGYHWDDNAQRADGHKGMWVPDEKPQPQKATGPDQRAPGAAPKPAPEAPTRASAYQSKVDAVNQAAAGAEKRADVQMVPSDDGWEIHVQGKPVATFEASKNAREVLAQARKLVGSAPAAASTASSATAAPAEGTEKQTTESAPAAVAQHPPAKPETPTTTQAAEPAEQPKLGEPKEVASTEATSPVEEGKRAETAKPVEAEKPVTTEAVDEAARGSAYHPENPAPTPSQGQYEAGNYAKGHVEIQGIPISIEHPKGSERPQGEGKPGKLMVAHYGYVKGTTDADSMHTDILVGDKPQATQHWVVDHLTPDGRYEQHKILFGFQNRKQALSAYRHHFSGRPVGHVTPMTTDELKAWLGKGDTSAPLSPVTIRSAGAEHVPVATTAAEVPAASAQGAAAATEPGHGHREPVDAGLAEQGAPNAHGGQLPGNSEETAGEGRGSPEPAGPEPSGGSREAGSAGAERRAAVERDFDLTGQDIGAGSLPTKYKANIAAIRVLKALETEGREATPEERATIAHYVGWGALKSVFDPDSKQWADEHKELKALLSNAEYEAARASILNAHYTSKAVVNAIYAALERLGFTNGRILEPSVGVGNFFGLMPAAMRAGSRLHGVELDPVTAKIAKALYPSARITEGGFQDFRIPAEYFDVAIGNPPFGSEAIVDADRAPYSGFSVHNYFLAKSIDKLRPGGVLAMVVSHNFLDAANERARAWIAQRANLIAVARLPETAFKANAGTEVVTDIVLLQKLVPGEKPASTDWVHTVDKSGAAPKTGETVHYRVNRFVDEHPQDVLGTPSLAGTMYRTGEYTVEPSGDLATQLSDWVKTLPADTYHPIDRTEEVSNADFVVPDGVKVGSFFEGKDGEILQRGEDQLGKQTATLWKPPSAAALERMKGLIGLREALRGQMRLELSADSSEKAIDAQRKVLRGLYDKFVKKYGFVNSQVNRRLFRDDTEAPLVQALEFDYDRGVSAETAAKEGVEPRKPSAKPADILQRRVMFPPQTDMKVGNAKDALIASLNYRGRLDMAYIRSVYDRAEAEILKELGDAVFRDPMGDWVTADEYLSGDVKTKLAEAKHAAQTDPELARNVAALQKVIPVDKNPSDIHASLGAHWVPEPVYEKFMHHITGGQASVKYVPATAQWLINIQHNGQSDLVNGRFGTDQMSAWKILENTLAGKGVVITKTERNPDGSTSTYVLEKETALAREKQNAIRNEWQKWLWSEADRADHLAQVYNDKLNRIVNRAYDGSHMTFPGMSPAITLLAHQKDGVWRGLQKRQILYDHVVGAGKTYQMAALAMEMRRLGIARKPMFVVPNHLTLQWRGEFTKLYPGAYVLVAEPSDFTKANRERFFAKIATGDWDAVVVGHSSLKRIGLPQETEKAILQEQQQQLAEAIEEMKQSRGDRHILRDMERIKKNLEAKFAAKLQDVGERDKAMSFDELGVDALFVDEMHEFKNLFYNSTMERHAGMGNPDGSSKAFDLFVKARWLFDTFGNKAPYVSATGTPVSNSLVEMFNMQRYHQYDELRRLGLHLFDAWARQFGQVESIYEVAPSGTGYRQSTRFSRFANLPALMSLYNEFADTITLSDLKEQEEAKGKRFPTPKIAGGKPTNVVAQRSPQVAAFMGTPRLVRDSKAQPMFGWSGTGAVIDEIRGKDGAVSYRAMVPYHEDSGPAGDGALRTIGSYSTLEDARQALVTEALSPSVGVDPNSILGQFQNLKQLTKATKGKINALSLTNLANKAGLDYRLIDPKAHDFPASKINLAVSRIVDLWRSSEPDLGTQLVFCDLSVPASARAQLANKPRNAYVRGEDGKVEMVRGSLHAIKGYEAYPFILSPYTSGGVKGFTIYDATSGVRLGQQAGTREAVMEVIERKLPSDDFRDRWAAKSTAAGEIPQADIDDYNGEHDINPDDANAIERDDIKGVSGSSSFSVYDDMKAKLIAAGIPAREIAFIHDYQTPTAKAKLFDAVNKGRVRVLLGSTQKMGAGTNVQERLVGLHHIDAPWRPSDLEQREGRIIRRGNKLYERDPDGFHVHIYRYATEQTYDTRRWQILEHKARGIEVLRKYDGTANSIDDIDGEAANAADMKAAASGDPLILEETQLRTEVRRLENMQAAHADQVVALRRKANYQSEQAERRLPALKRDLSDLIESAKEHPVPDEGLPAMVVAGAKFKAGTEDKKVITAISDVVDAIHDGDPREQPISYRGIEFELVPKKYLGDTFVELHSPIAAFASWNLARDKISASGLTTRLKNYVDALPSQREHVDQQIVEARESAARLLAESKQPFPEVKALEVARAQHLKIQGLLMAKGPPVPEDEKALLDAALAAQRERLRASGFGPELDALDRTARPWSDSEQVPGAGDIELKPGRMGVAEPRRAYGGLQLVVHSGGDETRHVEANFETRPETTPEQVDAGSAFIRSLIAYRDRRAGARVLADRITRDFVDRGHASLVGQRVTTHGELALAAQVLRDPRVEHMHVLLMRQGMVIQHVRWSSRLPGAAYFGTSDHIETIEDLAAAMQQSDADGYYLLHNHPSGRAIPSTPDRIMTVRVANDLPGFLGHVVLDHNEYAVIESYGGDELHEARLGSFNPAANPRVAHPLLGEHMNSAEELARTARTLYVGALEQGAKPGTTLVVATDSHARISAIVEYPTQALKNSTWTIARMRRLRAASGSNGYLFAITDQPGDMRWGMEQGIFTDVIDSAGQGAPLSEKPLPLSMEQQPDRSADMRRARPVERVGEEEPPEYKSEQERTAALRRVGAESDNGFLTAFKKALAPATVDEASAATASIARAHLGELAQATHEVQERLDRFSKAFDLLSFKDRMEFIDAMENGDRQPNKELQPAADAIRDMLDTWRDKVRDLGTGALENWIENYFPHVWQDPKRAGRAFGRMFARRPLQGSKSFLKQRKIPTTREGLEMGLRPVSTNPLVLALMKLREMQRYYTGVRLMEELKDAKLAVFFPSMRPLPPGWKVIEDAVGRVLQYSDIEKGFIIRGKYAMPENAARIINNHLMSSALRNFAPLELVRLATNAASSLQLGFSAFHLGFTTLDASISKVGLAVERLLRGEALGASRALLEGATPVGTVMNLHRGLQLLNAYSNPGQATPLLQQIVQGLIAAGGRGKMDRFFYAAHGISPFKGVGLRSLVEDIRAALRQPRGKVEALSKAIGSFPIHYAMRTWRDLEAMAHEYPVWALPFEVAGRLVRATTALIMEHVVPLQKLGVFSDLAQDYFRTHPKASPEEMVRAMQAIWDSVDNRLGEMVYDNLFWNRTFLDTMHLSIRAVGWNLGTVREIGGAPFDAVRLLTAMREQAAKHGGGPEDPTLTRFADAVGHRIPYVIAMTAVTAMLGAMLNYLFTGQGPQQTKDYFFPRTGRLNKYGEPERVSLPSYVKDIYEYSQHPVATAVNKLNPLFGILQAIYENEDFYGAPIRNPDDPWYKQLIEEVSYAARAVLPFSVQGSKQFIDQKNLALRVAPFIGVTPAPARVTSPAEMERFQRAETESAQLKSLRRQLRQAQQAGDARKVSELRHEIMNERALERQTERDIRRDKARATAQKISAILGGKSRTEGLAALRAAGYPALANLLEKLPPRPRPRVAQALAAFV